MKIPRATFKTGYNRIVSYEDLPWDDPKNPKMEFGILLLDKGEVYKNEENLERAFLLMTGDVLLKFEDGEHSKLDEARLKRGSIFDEDPTCLHVPTDVNVIIEALDQGVEIALIKTPNRNQFSPTLYRPDDCRSEARGKGTMRETSTRIVRTIFDKSNAPDANLVLGEVINYPGKWSSYPPHHHPQPEIYHYRFLPPQGFGFSMLGDEATQVKDGDTVLIFDVSHSQTSAPGYAMYYIWPIRHLDGNPYGSDYGTPIFEKEHLWVTKEENQDKIWPPVKK